MKKLIAAALAACLLLSGCGVIGFAEDGLNRLLGYEDDDADAFAPDGEPAQRTSAPMPDEPIEDFITASLLRLDAEISVFAYRISTDEVGDLFFGVLGEHPELFFVLPDVNWSYFEGSYVTTIEPTYSYGDPDDARRDIEALMLAVERAAGEIGEYDTDAETVAAVNDWLCLNAEYDRTLSHPTAFDLLVLGTGTCEAYTAAFGLLMNRYGIRWRRVESTAMNHAWNQVRVGGEWLHVDVTWNDPVPDREGRALQTFLMLDDDEIASGDNPHYDWTA